VKHLECLNIENI